MINDRYQRRMAKRGMRLMLCKGEKPIKGAAHSKTKGAGSAA